MEDFWYYVKAICIAAMGFAMILLTLVALLLFAFVLTIPAMASESTAVNVMDSQPGESKTEFLVRVATFMQGWSHTTGDESCGLISQQGEAYVVIVQTLHSQVMCDSDMTFEGYALTGETIHSHPTTDASGVIVLTERTKQLAGRALRGRDRIIAKRLDFSTNDYAIGPGYLVDNGLLLYQNGIGTSTRIAEIPVQ